MDKATFGCAMAGVTCGTVVGGMVVDTSDTAVGITICPDSGALTVVDPVKNG